MAKKAKRAATDAFEHTIEIERKYTVPPGFDWPDLSELDSVAAVDPPVVQDLEATYLDTAGLGLLAHHWVLRRRTGGTDAGWHLKRPLPGGGRDELRHPPGRSAAHVPAAVQRAVAVHTRGEPLVPIARLSTLRTLRTLRDAAGTALAEMVLDEVEAVAFDAAGEVLDTSTWREIEVELAAGDVTLLREVSSRLVSAGAWPSASASKLAQALSSRLEAEPLLTVEPPTRYGPASAVGVVLAYLAAQVTHLQTHDPLVRVDAPDAVHQMRVAARRLRSVLASFRPLFDRSVTDPIREELQWLGVELGEARDVEVVRDHLLAQVAAEPAVLRRGPVARRIRTTLTARYRDAHRHGVEQLSADRYYALLDTLDALVADPPLAEHAAALPVEELLRLTRRTWRRLEALHGALAELTDRQDRDLQLHEIRKAAKRARYAGEALSATIGPPARRYASAMAAIQTSLGDHQDSVVVRGHLLALAADAEAAGEPSFSYGRLHALEQARAAATEDEFAVAWRAASARPLRRWFTG